jgi:hypothetical protein
MSVQLRLLKQCIATTTTTTTTTMTKPGPVAAAFSTMTTGTPFKSNMSKRDIVEEIAETHELSIAKSERILNTVLDTIVEVRTYQKHTNARSLCAVCVVTTVL